MNRDLLLQRTKQFALQVIKLTESVPSTRAGNVLANQLLRSATSVGANYRSACRARSRADFISKINIAEEEADESMYWLDLIVESNLTKIEKAGSLLQEANELTAIFTASGRTAKRNK